MGIKLEKVGNIRKNSFRFFSNKLQNILQAMKNVILMHRSREESYFADSLVYVVLMRTMRF